MLFGLVDLFAQVLNEKKSAGVKITVRSYDCTTEQIFVYLHVKTHVGGSFYQRWILVTKKLQSGKWEIY
jgi:hypothetical protein